MLIGKGGVPILPDGVISILFYHRGDLCGGAAVIDFELSYGVGAGGVAAGVGFAACADFGDTELNESIAKCGGFAGGDNDSGIGKAETQSQYHLDEAAVGQQVVFEIVNVEGGSHTRERKGHTGLPIVFNEIVCVFGKGESFESPIVQAEEDTETEFTHPSGGDAVEGIEAVVEIGFWARGMKFFEGLAVVGFLEHCNTIDSGVEKLGIFGGGQGENFHRDGTEFGFEFFGEISQVIHIDEIFVFAADEKDVPETFGGDGVSVGKGLVYG